MSDPSTGREGNRLWTPPGYEFEQLRKGFDPAGAPPGARVVRVGNEAYRLTPLSDDLAKGFNAEAQARKQPYRLAPLNSHIGVISGLREPYSNFRTTHELLREVPKRNPVVASVLRKRQSQVAGFARRPRFRGDTGFRVAMRDKTARPGPGMRKRMREIEDVLIFGGYVREHPRTGQPGVWDHEGSTKAMGLQRALRALVWDSLCLDAAAFRIEVGLNERRYPVVWWNPVDAALIRYALPQDFGDDAKGTSLSWEVPKYRPEIRKGADVAFVMLDPGGISVQREFTWRELAYLVRNPRTDQKVAAYGYPELEMLIDLITGILYGIKFNVQYFDHNHMPPGILTLGGIEEELKDEVVEGFRQQLRMMVGGPGQFHALPILTSEQPQAAAIYTPIRNMDGVGMFWKDWLLFSANFVCALFGMDSTEINCVNFGQTANALSNQSPEARLKAAQESGLEPFLAALAQWFNEAIVWLFDADLTFEWTGINLQDAAEERAAREDRMQWAMSTPNRERARDDEPPIYDPLDRPLYDACRRRVAEALGLDTEALDEEENDTAMRLIRRAYERANGEWAKWPDAPLNALAYQAWAAEHGISGGQGGMGDGAPWSEDEESGDGEPTAGNSFAGGSDGGGGDARVPAGLPAHAGGTPQALPPPAERGSAGGAAPVRKGLGIRVLDLVVGRRR